MLLLGFQLSATVMSASRPDHRRRHPPFLRDLSSPISSSFRLPPASMRREAQASTPPPPPPLLSLDDLSHLSPSRQPATPPQATTTPSPQPPRGAVLFSSPLRSNGSPGPSAWWTPSREENPREGSPMDGVVQYQQQSPTTPSGQQSQQQKVALITLPPPREVARPEMPRDSAPAAGRVDEEEWVTVFGYVASPPAKSMQWVW